MSLKLFKHSIESHQETEIVLDQPGRYEVRLVGEYASVKVSGRFQLVGTDAEQYQVILYHQAPHTTANTSLLGTVDDRAFLRIQGKIIIEENCHDSQSFLTERILLLSATAKAEVVPDLEILNHEVKCSHAASLSRIPDAQIFYLQSRGITANKAKQLIAAGFLLQ